MADEQGKPAKPSRIAALRARYEWLDHLMRAGQSYTENHGNHYAAAITYFSVLALFPLLMVGFAAAAFFLRANQNLIDQLKQSITTQVPGMGATLAKVIDSALHSAGTVGTIGLLVALYSGLGWMSNLREALSAQWGQRAQSPKLLRKLLVDLIALISLGLALVISSAVAAVGGLAPQIAGWLGLGSLPWLSPLIRLGVVVVGLLASALVFLWAIARLPREAVTWRSAGKAALLGAVGFEVIKQVMVVYIVKVTHSPTGALFGPILGLMVFIFTVSRFLLFLTAWAATARENQIIEPPPAPPPAVIHSEVTVRTGPGVGTTAGLLGAGALAGLVGTLLTRRRP
ncbi:MAG TPA: inner membrane protein YhjD [Pseudonocardia sp.]